MANADAAELEAWLRLTLTPGLGPAALRALLKEYGLPQAVLGASRSALARYLRPEVVEALHSAALAGPVERTLAWLREPGRHLLTLADRDYPRLLLEISDPPPVLYCRGRTELLARPTLAIVGSRNASAQGRRDAERFAHAFSAAGVTVVSGLAQGIDAAAHRGALAAEGSTVAVLGTGADLVYPPANAALAEAIGGRGLLVSEFPLGTPALAHNFPRRNRLISGLALGCVVVEAAIASGSLITARLAAEQGREVFALPGSIHSPLAKGCHALIKSGAKLVECAEDVFAELPRLGAGARARSVPRAAPAPPAQEDALLAHMGFEPVDVDSLCARSGLGAERIAAALLRLELDGRVAALPGGLYQRLS
jgi:DNA processing protein